ncbi:type II toxin-antitoxin system HipA family toxin [Solimicrobium silvestre]|uniref:HipA-like C-terminal domain n=1 Tax=Solimicrobium silvestre TaxID=2099400 RepID=A0A2S9H2W4_9BURK|nr:type II toxin-antitoxin system HipA family toxin [Solimicrobium silvestre]PRC94325.1 HipA-like C-terminal domain [Solimicrobium silvestre]
MPNQKKLFVFAKIENEFAPAGILTLTEENTNVIASEFAYGTKYLERPNAIEIDPVSLSISPKKAIYKKKVAPVSDLRMFGGIRDAAPDAWGRRVIEAKLKAKANDLPESTYLLEAGSNRVGALDIRPDISSPAKDGVQSVADLHYLLDAAERIEEGAPIPAKLEIIFQAGASLGGARPKATVRDEQGVMWLAKFQSRHERLDVPNIEAATMHLASECGMTVPEVKVIQIGDRNVMLIRRFDRYWANVGEAPPMEDALFRTTPGNGRVEKSLHFISGLTLLSCDEMQSREKSYSDLAHAIRKYCGQTVIRDNNRELFTRMVYNIFVSNDDDHPRNHGFLWDPTLAAWRLSPLYDVMPRSTIATERYQFLGVGQLGRVATLDNAITAKEAFNLSAQEATTIIADVWERVREWKSYFEKFGAPTESIEQATNAFRHIDKISTPKLRALLP